MHLPSLRQEKHNKSDLDKLSKMKLLTDGGHSLHCDKPKETGLSNSAYKTYGEEKPTDKLLATFVNQMVASAFELSADDLMQVSRGNARASRARQISIYLMNTVLSFSLSKIATIYQKDRTTVGYACRIIEDMRDSPAFDDRILELEETVKTVLKLAAYIPKNGSCHEK